MAIHPFLHVSVAALLGIATLAGCAGHPEDGSTGGASTVASSSAGTGGAPQTSSSSSSSGGGTGGAPQTVWSNSYTAGQTDSMGNLMGGTELRALVGFQGSLFAGIGYWEDTEGFASAPNPPSPNLPGAQVLRLDAPGGKWQQEFESTAFVPSGPNAGQRVDYAVAALGALTLTTDSSGNPLSPPVQALAAATWAYAPGLRVWTRMANDPTWTLSVLGGSGPNNKGRAFATHVDTKVGPATGISSAFTGSDIGIYAGQYDASTSTLAWSQTPEAWYESGSRDDTPPPGGGWRVMAFADCDGSLYASVGPSIYQRQDGPSPTWKIVYTGTFPAGYAFDADGGLRGLTCVGAPGSSVLYTSLVGNPAQIWRVDPHAGFAATLDLDISQFLTSAWGFRVGYVLPAYNDFAKATDPVTDEDVLLVGFEAISQSATVPVWDPDGVGPYIASANYLVRRPSGQYQVFTIDDPTLVDPHSTRTMTVSPFAADDGHVVYAGGFDCDQVPSHDTAWGSVAPLAGALGH